MDEPLITYNDNDGFFAMNLKDIVKDLKKLKRLIEILKFSPDLGAVDPESDSQIHSLIKKIKVDINSSKDFIQTDNDEKAIKQVQKSLKEFGRAFQVKKMDLEDEFSGHTLDPYDDEEIGLGG